MRHKLWLGLLHLGAKLQGHLSVPVPNTPSVVSWGVIPAIPCLLIFHGAKVAEDGIFGRILFLDLIVVLEPVGGGGESCGLA